MNLEERLRRCEEASNNLERRVRKVEKKTSRYDDNGNVEMKLWVK